MWINVEIKDLSKRLPVIFLPGILWKWCLELFRRSPWMSRWWFLLSITTTCAEVKKLAPHILTGVLTEHKYAGDPLEAARIAKADAWHPGFRYLD